MNEVCLSQKRLLIKTRNRTVVGKSLGHLSSTRCHSWLCAQGLTETLYAG